MTSSSPSKVLLLFVCFYAAMTLVAVSASKEAPLDLQHARICSSGRVCGFAATMFLNIDEKAETSHQEIREGDKRFELTFNFEVTASCDSQTHADWQYFRVEITNSTGGIPSYERELEKRPFFFIQDKTAGQIHSIYTSDQDAQPVAMIKRGLIAALAKRFSSSAATSLKRMLMLQQEQGSSEEDLELAPSNQKITYEFHGSNLRGHFHAVHTISRTSSGGLLLEETADYVDTQKTKERLSYEGTKVSIKSKDKSTTEVDSKGRVVQIAETSKLTIGTDKPPAEAPAREIPDFGKSKFTIDFDVARVAKEKGSACSEPSMTLDAFEVYVDHELDGATSRSLFEPYTEEELQYDPLKHMNPQLVIHEAVRQLEDVNGPPLHATLSSLLRADNVEPISQIAWGMYEKGDLSHERMKQVLASVGSLRTPESYHVLAQIISNRDVDQDIRMQAIGALHGSPDDRGAVVPRSILDTVADVAFTRSDPLNGEATLLLGSLCNGNRDQHAAHYISMLEKTVKLASSPDIRSLFAAALRNAHAKSNDEIDAEENAKNLAQLMDLDEESMDVNDNEDEDEQDYAIGDLETGMTAGSGSKTVMSEERKVVGNNNFYGSARGSGKLRWAPGRGNVNGEVAFDIGVFKFVKRSVFAGNYAGDASGKTAKGEFEFIILGFVVNKPSKTLSKGDIYKGGRCPATLTNAPLIGSIKLARDVPLFKTVVPVGPVPVTVSIKLFGEMGYRAYFGAWYDCDGANGKDHALMSGVGPYARIALGASAAVEAFIARAGISGTLDIYSGELPVFMIMNKASARSKVDAELKSMSGVIELFAEIGFSSIKSVKDKITGKKDDAKGDTKASSSSSSSKSSDGKKLALIQEDEDVDLSPEDWEEQLHLPVIDLDISGSSSYNGQEDEEDDELMEEDIQQEEEDDDSSLSDMDADNIALLYLYDNPSYWSRMWNATKNAYTATKNAVTNAAKTVVNHVKKAANATGEFLKKAVNNTVKAGIWLRNKYSEVENMLKYRKSLTLLQWRGHAQVQNLRTASFQMDFGDFLTDGSANPPGHIDGGKERDVDRRKKPTPAPTDGPSPGPTPTRGPQPGPTDGPTPTDGPSPGPTDGPSPGPTDGPSPGPTDGPSPGPTDGPSPGPTDGPSPGPTKGPSPGPTDGPSPGPTDGPSPGPTDGPSPGPTDGPSPGPTDGPSPGPTDGPSPGPTKGPSPGPTDGPSPGPTDGPSPGPTDGPSPGPTDGPSPGPTDGPTPCPKPTPAPTPCVNPTAEPSPTTPPTEAPTRPEVVVVASSKPPPTTSTNDRIVAESQRTRSQIRQNAQATENTVRSSSTQIQDKVQSSAKTLTRDINSQGSAARRVARDEGRRVQDSVARSARSDRDLERRVETREDDEQASTRREERREASRLQDKVNRLASANREQRQEAQVRRDDSRVDNSIQAVSAQIERQEQREDMRRVKAEQRRDTKAVEDKIRREEEQNTENNEFKQLRSQMRREFNEQEQQQEFAQLRNSERRQNDQQKTARNGFRTIQKEMSREQRDNQRRRQLERSEKRMQSAADESANVEQDIARLNSNVRKTAEKESGDIEKEFNDFQRDLRKKERSDSRRRSNQRVRQTIQREEQRSRDDRENRRLEKEVSSGFAKEEQSVQAAAKQTRAQLRSEEQQEQEQQEFQQVENAAAQASASTSRSSNNGFASTASAQRRSRSRSNADSDIRRIEDRIQNVDDRLQSNNREIREQIDQSARENDDRLRREQDQIRDQNSKTERRTRNKLRNLGKRLKDGLRRAFSGNN